ncbi:alpha/beta hydrolase [Burkholderia sp. L27(2015)]|uniref:alpha/beta hydrolase n=1 Tax=Burkholderia sp. L27(2015) TaxID=1641858 RepID=UPI00131CB180|nr:alpha/beta hydrolase [Burkholderia sp. L27(2015)]
MTMPYRGMDQAALNVAYNNTQAIPDFAAVYAGFKARSAQFYETAACQRDLRYGQQSRQRFDVFPSQNLNAPTWIFIHGGYWQGLNKEDLAFVAQGPLAHGFNVVLAEYTLAPQASMTQIVDEIGSLLDHLAGNHDRLVVGRGPVCLSGHSAGGHLSAVHRSHPLITHAMPISPLVDLEPISLSWLNEKLNLTPHEIDAYSPLRHIGKGAPMTVAVGAAELPELVRHASEYATAAQNAGETVRYVTVDNGTHFSVLDDLAQPSGILMSALVSDMARWAFADRTWMTSSRVSLCS